MSDNQDSDSEVNFNLNNQEIGVEENRGRGDFYYDRRGIDQILRHRPTAHIKPDSYNGEEDWDQYISYFEDCAELCQWTEREKLLYLATSLKQQARIHYSSLPAEEKNSYRSLIFSLEKRFGSKRQQSRWISKLQNRVRGRNETIGAFGDEIRLYSQKAYVTLDQEAQEMLALQQFYKNVSPELRCRLMDRDCRTIREAVEIVERYEEVMGKTDASARPSQVRGVSNCKTTVDQDYHAEGTRYQVSTEEMASVKSTLENIEKRLSKLEGNDQSKNRWSRTCFKCGSGEHLFRNCPLVNRDKTKPFERQGNAKPSFQ